MATKKQTSDSEVLVLVDCIYGKSGEVVTLAAAEVEHGTANGLIDANPEAVKAAK